MRGVHVVTPVSGHLACGDSGAGKLEDVEVIARRAEEVFVREAGSGRTACAGNGGTIREALDPVRYISNRSSGKMGYSIAENAAKRGAKVTLLSGPVSLDAPRVWILCRF